MNGKYKFPCFTDTTFTDNKRDKCQKVNGGIFRMKATGIVRRIDGCVIIGQSLEGRINAGFSLILSIQQ